MTREGIEARRLAIADELIAPALPRARADRNFPAWVTRTLSADRRFGSRDRRFYRELVYAAVRFLPWIEGVAEQQRARAALWLSADTPETQDARAALAPDAPPRTASLKELATAFDTAFPGASATAAALLPGWVADECPALLEPAELAVVQRRAPLWLRIPTSGFGAAIEALAAEGIRIEPEPHIPGAARVVSGPDVTRTRAFADGLVEVQDIGSQWVLHTTAPRPGELWLDACAGAGGKTLQLASMVGSSTPVVAHDIRAAALVELRMRAARAHVASIRIVSKSEGEFDAVLVDAPCSGSGTWRRSPHLKWQTTRDDLRRAAGRQVSLLAMFARQVRPGGRLVYATCSIAATENAGVVRAFLAAHAGFTAETPGSDPTGSILLPSRLNSDGFFVSVLRRADR